MAQVRHAPIRAACPITVLTRTYGEVQCPKASQKNAPSTEDETPIPDALLALIQNSALDPAPVITARSQDVGKGELKVI
jgi:hypothetical protein